MRAPPVDSPDSRHPAHPFDPATNGYPRCPECPVCGTDSCETLEQLGMFCDTMTAATLAMRPARGAALHNRQAA